MQLVKGYLGRKHRSDLSDKADGRIAHVRTGWALYTMLFMLNNDQWYGYGKKSTYNERKGTRPRVTAILLMVEQQVPDLDGDQKLMRSGSVVTAHWP